MTLAWTANPEADVVGYKVYYDSDGKYPFDGTGAAEGPSPITVGNVSAFQLTGLPPDAYVTVTAYDAGAGDFFDQIDGDESWFSSPVAVP